MAGDVGARKTPTKLRERNRWAINASRCGFHAADGMETGEFVSCSTLTRPGKNKKKKSCGDKQTQYFPCTSIPVVSNTATGQASTRCCLSPILPSFRPSVHSFAQLGSLRVRVIFSFTLNEDLIELNLVKATWC